jgi:hypothetical protein
MTEGLGFMANPKKNIQLSLLSRSNDLTEPNQRTNIAVRLTQPSFANVRRRNNASIQTA